MFSRARCVCVVRVPDQFLLSRGGGGGNDSSDDCGFSGGGGSDSTTAAAPVAVVLVGVEVAVAVTAEGEKIGRTE